MPLNTEPIEEAIGELETQLENKLEEQQAIQETIDDIRKHLSHLYAVLDDINSDGA